MTNFITKNKNLFERIAAALFALCVWQAAAMFINSGILLASPVQVAARLIELIPTADFWQRILFTMLRIVGGFAAAAAAGCLLAALAGRFRLAEVMLRPFMVTIKSIPVASFIVLLFIFFSSENIALSISFLMVLPVIYTNVLQGIKSADKKLLEAAKLFRLPWHKKFFYIQLEQIKPFLLSGLSVALGLAWKAGTAAEVIGIPSGSIGEMLYEAKVYFMSSDLLAWTAVIVLLSAALEKLTVTGVNHVFTSFERK